MEILFKLTIKIINFYDGLFDRYWDHRLRIRTCGRLETFQLDPYDSTHLGNAKIYQPVRTRVLKNALNELQRKIQFKEFHFVDIGSGKGRAIYWSKEYGFKNYLGIEFSPHLCQIAKENSKVLSWGEILCEDVTKNTYENKKTVFFLYNPFDGLVMRKFIRMLSEIKSECYIIYVNPLLHYCFEMEGPFQLITTIESINHNNRIMLFKNVL